VNLGEEGKKEGKKRPRPFSSPNNANPFARKKGRKGGEGKKGKIRN